MVNLGTWIFSQGLALLVEGRLEEAWPPLLDALEQNLAPRQNTHAVEGHLTVAESLFRWGPDLGER